MTRRFLFSALCVVLCVAASTDAATLIVRNNGTVKSKQRSCAGVTSVIKAKPNCASAASCAAAIEYRSKVRVK